MLLNSKRYEKRSRVGAQLVWRILLAVLFTMSFAACGKTPVAQDITQNQANQIVTLLHSNGVGASSSKEIGGRGKYTVEVKDSNYARAVSLITKNNLPGTPEVTFSELISERGIIPDSREVESLRIDHAMALQIREMLMTHSGIHKASVVVRSSFADSDGDPSVSVVIQREPGVELSEEEIVGIVSRAVPGVESEQIFLSLNEREKLYAENGEEGVFYSGKKITRVPLVPFLFGWHIAEGDYDGLALTLFGFMIFVAFVGAAVGYWYAYLHQSRQLFETDFQPRSLKFDDERRNLPGV